jgi:hypothetical protein
MEDARLVHAALGYQVMEMGMEINPVPKGLDGGDDPGRKRAPGHNLEVTAQGPEGAATEIAEETAIELEEDPQPLGDGEDDLAMRHIQEKRLPHPFPPFLDPLGMTRWAESPGPAREHNEPLLGAVGTSDAGEPAAGIAAVKILLDNLLDDRSEKPILPLETTLILRQEPVEMMEKHPVENGPLRMPRTIDVASPSGPVQIVAGFNRNRWPL